MKRLINTLQAMVYRNRRSWLTVITFDYGINTANSWQLLGYSTKADYKLDLTLACLGKK